MNSRSSPSAGKPPRSSVLRVALTGGIACGKSVVARVLEDKGFYIHSADRVARSLVSPGSPSWESIVRRFGRDILRPDRTIDRAKLGSIVFSDPGARRFLEKLLHPLVLADRTRALSRIEREGRHAVFVSEAALVFEAGYDKRFDRIVVVHCDENLQVARLMERDGIAEEEARRKIASQLPQKEKVRRADYVIDTSGSLAETVEQAERVSALLLQDAESKKTRLRRPRPWP